MLPYFSKRLLRRSRLKKFIQLKYLLLNMQRVLPSAFTKASNSKLIYLVLRFVVSYLHICCSLYYAYPHPILDSVIYSFQVLLSTAGDINDTTTLILYFTHTTAINLYINITLLTTCSYAIHIFSSTIIERMV